MTTKDAIQNNIYTSIDEHINLYNIIGNKKCTEILKSIVDCYYNDNAEGKNPILKPIFIMGERGTGKATSARAFSNSLGYKYKHTLGETLNKGGECVTDFILNSDNETACHISGADELSLYVVDKLFKLITEGVLYVNHPFERKIDAYDMPGRLLLFSAQNRNKAIEPLVKHCIVFKLEPYRVEEIYLILQQRCKYWNLISAYCALSKIAESAKGDVGKAVDILELAYRVMRGDGREELGEEDVLKAIGHHLD